MDPGPSGPRPRPGGRRERNTSTTPRLRKSVRVCSEYVRVAAAPHAEVRTPHLGEICVAPGRTVTTGSLRPRGVGVARVRRGRSSLSDFASRAVGEDFHGRLQYPSMTPAERERDIDPRLFLSPILCHRSHRQSFVFSLTLPPHHRVYTDAIPRIWPLLSVAVSHCSATPVHSPSGAVTGSRSARSVGKRALRASTAR